jgi:hypothetical protein
MSQPIHTPGPVKADEFLIINSDSPKPKLIGAMYWGRTKTPIDCYEISEEEARGNARLLRAAYNAFDSAARKLGINAVEFAERMQDGGIAELVESLDGLEDCLGMLFESGRIQYPTDDAPIIAGRLETARDVLAQMKGDEHG